MGPPQVGGGLQWRGARGLHFPYCLIDPFINDHYLVIAKPQVASATMVLVA